MSWAQRVAWAQGAAGSGGADPVAGALTFLRVMQRLDGSAAG